MLQPLQSQQKETLAIIKQGSWQRRILPYTPLLVKLITSWSRDNGAYSIVTRLQVQLKNHVLIPSKAKKFSSPKHQTNSEGCLCFH